MKDVIMPVIVWCVAFVPFSLAIGKLIAVGKGKDRE